MKICSKCRRELPEEQFHKSKKNKDGYQYMCKDCVSEYGKRRYASRMDSTQGKAGSGSKLDEFTPRELLEELRRRGYKWNQIWIEEVVTTRKYVKL